MLPFQLTAPLRQLVPPPKGKSPPLWCIPPAGSRPSSILEHLSLSKPSINGITELQSQSKQGKNSGELRYWVRYIMKPPQHETTRTRLRTWSPKGTMYLRQRTVRSRPPPGSVFPAGIWQQQRPGCQVLLQKDHVSLCVSPPWISLCSHRRPEIFNHCDYVQDGTRSPLADSTQKPAFHP